VALEQKRTFRTTFRSASLSGWGGRLPGSFPESASAISIFLHTAMFENQMFSFLFAIK